VRGILYRTAEEYDKAIPDYSRAIELNPENYRYYLERAHINSHPNVEKYDQAISDYSKVMELKPEEAGAIYYLQGYAYRKKGDFDNAIFIYNKAIEKKFLCYEERGDAYIALGEYDKAISDYDRSTIKSCS